MAEPHQQPVFLDATVVSNFASTDGIRVLGELLVEPAVVPTVRAEIERGLDSGHDYLRSAASAIGDRIAVREVPRSVEDSELRARLDSGEAETILGAIDCGGTVATDDLAARRAAADRGLPVTGSVGLLVLGVKRSRFDAPTADDWLDSWRTERGFYAPVDTVVELLDDE